MLKKEIFILLVLCSTTMFPQVFSASNETVFIAPIVSSTDVGDYDNDGDLDIILMGLQNGIYYSQIYDNDAIGGFSLSMINLLHQYRNGQVEFVDYDNDNDLDIFISGIIDNESYRTRLYKNTNASFTEVAYDFGGSIINNQFFWSDYDNDGDLDVILMGDVDTFSSLTFMYRNDGNDQFTAISSSIGGFSQGEIKAVDLDNDGDDDIIVTGLNAFLPDELEIYRNDGDFNFVYTLTLEGYFNGDLEVIDANGDGFMDFFKTGNMADNGSMVNTTSKLFINSGSFSFTEFTDIVFPSLYNYSQIEIADFTGNGENDFLLTGRLLPSQSTSIASIFENQGNLSLIENSSVGITPSFYYGLELADFDNDHDVDVFVTNNNFSKTFINQSTVSNTMPIPPNSLEAQVSDSNVLLLWSEGTDNESQAKQLTYNIYVGTATGTTDVVSPMSDLNTGYRKVVGIGNSQYKNQAVLNNLPNGTYYWAVQSVDNQYEGSTFSTEQTFTINNLSVEEFKTDLSIHYYPNPVSSQLTISSANFINKVVISTILGEKLNTILINELTDFKIDLTNYDSGIYFLSMHSTSGQKIIKIIKR